MGFNLLLLGNVKTLTNAIMVFTDVQSPVVNVKILTELSLVQVE